MKNYQKQEFWNAEKAEKKIKFNRKSPEILKTACKDQTFW